MTDDQPVTPKGLPIWVALNRLPNYEEWQELLQTDQYLPLFHAVCYLVERPADRRVKEQPRTPEECWDEFDRKAFDRIEKAAKGDIHAGTLPAVQEDGGPWVTPADFLTWAEAFAERDPIVVPDEMRVVSARSSASPDVWVDSEIDAKVWWRGEQESGSKTASEREFRKSAAQHAANARYESLRKEKKRFQASYRELRKLLSNMTRKELIEKVYDGDPVPRVATTWAKEADKEDGFVRSPGRPKTAE